MTAASSRCRLRRGRNWRHWACWLAVASFTLLGAGAAAQDPDEDEDNPYRAGAISRYEQPGGLSHRALAEVVHLSADEVAALPLSPGPFSATFEAQLLVQSPGAHRVLVYAAGHVQVKLAGTTVLDAAAAEPKWLDSAAIDLPFGFQALEVRYRRTDEPVRLNLFWEGPGFALEPVPARLLFHEREHTPPDEFTRGRLVLRALRCAGCHELPHERVALAAPALDHVRGNISRAWLVARLTSAPAKPATADEETPTATQNMPHFGLPPADAAAVADYVLSISRPVVPAPAAKPDTARPPAKQRKSDDDEEQPPPAPPSAAAGGTLFRSLGCLACHRVGELGTDGPFGGGDLTAIAAKRPRDFFALWLRDPAATNASHRMPVFALADDEVTSLALYLAALGQPAVAADPFDTADADVGRVARGKALVRELRCAACHELGERDAPAPKRLPLDLAAVDRQATKSCLEQPDPAQHRPGYQLDDNARRAVRAYLSTAARSAGSDARLGTDAPIGSDVLAERNCLACHARGHVAGLAPHLPAIAAADETLAEVTALLRPPSLAGVGDKLHDDALLSAITVSGTPRQTWLRARMPRFSFSPPQTQALVRHFVNADRIPARPEAQPGVTPATDPTTAGAGARLVTADGFGCTSCHALGKWAPQKVAPGAEGVNLSTIGARVRREWFERWVRNPARIVPAMEMPAIVQPIRGVLDENLDRQIAAIWHVLNQPDFTPPAPNALRVVRHANLPGDARPADVLTDVIDVGGSGFTKPLVVGLANRHNVLYDLATARLAAWWTGDTARQQTRGKTWFWEAGVPQLVPVAHDESDDAACELVLWYNGQPCAAVPQGQFLTAFDSLAHVDEGIEFTQRLKFELAGRAVLVHVTQRMTALPPDENGASGFRRSVRIAGLPNGVTARLLALGAEGAIDAAARTAIVRSQPAPLRVVLREPPQAEWTNTPRGPAVNLAHAADAVECQLDYRAEIVADQFPPLPAIDRRVKPAELHVVPGFAAVRLPVTDQCMPTELAWRPDGTLVVASLEGRVWLGRDTDGDTLEDALEPFSDDLAAPYGVAAAGDAIDVINKYALLRLFDDDGDRRADRMQTVASGWGHTRDYHDWAVGLPREPDGSYIVSLPSQRDNRSEAAALLRGKLVRLVPRAATTDDPRLFSLQEICGGLRFAQGIARSADGELFVTDNQGNYNPFNELNHIRPQARYGFINSLESRAGMKPGAHVQAAIEIPHPWTRSVNGICFLAAPEGAGQSSAELFGPFAGHLVGCEYDTRRLVRMSLEQVGGQFQGAIYPLSREPAQGEETFEGPITCQMSPAGDLYVGSLRDSGWGAGSNTGSLVRLKRDGPLPAGIAQVRARPDGFAIEFTQPVDRALAADAKNYAVSSYQRISTPEYGGPDVDRRIESIARVEVAKDGRSVLLHLPQLRAGFVYEFHLRKLTDGPEFFPAEAYYTLRRLATDSN
ncbi:MAG: c-type cytochrome [Pirellulales bacterium]